MSKKLSLTPSSKFIEFSNTSEVKQYVYIYIYTYIRNGAGQKKTGYNSKTLNPVFNKIFSFLLDHSCITDKKLRVAVWDHDFFTEDDFNGESVVDLSTISLNAGTHRFGLCFNKRYIIYYCYYT